MAGPVDSYIVLPDDSGNTGKKDREQTRVVGGQTVYEKFIVKVRQAQILGVYRAATAQLAAVASATNGTSTGLLWAHVPSATTNKKVRLRRMVMTSQNNGITTAQSTAPRIRVDRMTFTGTASGASITACKNDSGYPSPVFDLRTAVTGLTVSLVAQLGTGAIMGSVTAAGSYSPSLIDLFPAASEEDEWNVFAPGEGIAVYQDTAGTSSDQRLVNLVMLWDEIDTA